MVERGRLSAIETVMVPVDFSDASRKALRNGMALAARLEASLVVCHVVPFLMPLGYAYPAEPPAREQTTEVKQKLEELVASESRDGVHRRFVVTVGDAKDDLLRIARDEKAGLVVMGAHGYRAFERWLMGSVTEYVIRKSPVPVWSVRETAGGSADAGSDMTIRKVLFATDLTDAGGGALEMAFAVAKLFDAELTVLHVMRPLDWHWGSEAVPLDMESTSAAVRQGLERQLQGSLTDDMRAHGGVRTVLVEGTPYERILGIAEDEPADLIVLNTRSKSGLDRILLGSTAERVVRGAHVPVLSVPPQPSK